MRTYLLAAASLLVASAAQAQLSVTTVQPVSFPTYSAVFIALPPAPLTTDFFTITAGTKVVRVVRISCSGSATASESEVLVLVKRASPNSGGTSTTLTAVRRDENDPEATAIVQSYTANPTALGTLIGNVSGRRIILTTNSPSGTIAAPPASWDFIETTLVRQGMKLYPGEVLAVNGGGSSFGAGTGLACSIRWVEQ